MNESFTKITWIKCTLADSSQLSINHLSTVDRRGSTVNQVSIGSRSTIDLPSVDCRCNVTLITLHSELSIISTVSSNLGCVADTRCCKETSSGPTTVASSIWMSCDHPKGGTSTLMLKCLSGAGVGWDGGVGWNLKLYIIGGQLSSLAVCHYFLQNSRN